MPGPQVSALISLSAVNWDALVDVVGKIVLKPTRGPSLSTQTKPLGQVIAGLLKSPADTADESTPEDGRRVLTVKTAIDIVQEEIGALTELADLAKFLVPFPIGDKPQNVLAHLIVARLRKEALGQDNPERYATGKHRTRK